MSVDHIRPLHTHKHLAFRFSNLQPMLLKCNQRKGTNIIDYRPWRWEWSKRIMKQIMIGVVIGFVASELLQDMTLSMMIGHLQYGLSYIQEQWVMASGHNAN